MILVSTSGLRALYLLTKSIDKVLADEALFSDFEENSRDLYVHHTLEEKTVIRQSF